eukprot:3940745-Rhodomonas_salina.17
MVGTELVVGCCAVSWYKRTLHVSTGIMLVPAVLKDSWYPHAIGKSQSSIQYYSTEHLVPPYAVSIPDIV